MINKVAVIGTGVIGAGWIIRCLAHNKKVVVFDKDLKLNAIYLKGISIIPNLNEKMKLHLLSVLIEWQKMSKILGDKPNFTKIK